MAQDLKDQSTTVADKPDSGTKADEKAASALAEKPLDDILAEIDEEYEKGTKPEPKPQQKADSDVSDERLKKLDAIEARLFNDDVSKAVATVKTEFGDGLAVSDRVVRGYLSELYNEDERFKRAFDARDSNPATFQRVLKAVASEARKDFGEPIDAQTTSDSRALEAAVRGTKSANIAEDDGEPPEFKGDDAEFEDWKAKHG